MTTRALDLHHLHLGWPAASADSLQIDRLTLAPGQTLVLRDPGGCGKSTLLSLAAGVLPAQAGTVQVLTQAGTVQVLGQGWATLGAAARGVGCRGADHCNRRPGAALTAAAAAAAAAPPRQAGNHSAASAASLSGNSLTAKPCCNSQLDSNQPQAGASAASGTTTTTTRAPAASHPAGAG